MRLDRQSRKALKNYKKSVKRGAAHADFVGAWAGRVNEHIEALPQPDPVKQLFLSSLMGTAEFQSSIAEAIHTDLRGESAVLAKPFKRLAERTMNSRDWEAGQEVLLWGQVLLVIGRSFSDDFESFLETAKQAIPFDAANLDYMIEIASQIPDSDEPELEEVLDLESLIFTEYLNQMGVNLKMTEAEQDYIYPLLDAAWKLCWTEFQVTYTAATAAINN